MLIIEDDAPSAALARYLLTAAGHEVLTAADGELGAAMALADRPDLVLCDLQLPRLNGYEVLAALRGAAGWRRVPLIAVTASSMSGDREVIIASGFDGYISKPISPETFVSEIEAFLQAPGAAPPAAGTLQA